MEINFSKFKPHLEFSWRRVWVVLVLFVVVFGVFVTSLVAYAESYRERVSPGVYLGHIYIGGMTRSEIYDYLRTMSDKLTDDGIVIKFELNGNEETITIHPTIVSEDNYIELIKIDVEEEVDRLLAFGKQRNVFVNALSAVQGRLVRPRLLVSHIDIDERSLANVVLEKVSEYEREPKNSEILINSITPLSYEVTSSTVGRSFSADNLTGDIIAKWSKLQVPDFTLTLHEKEPEVTEEIVAQIEDRLSKIFAGGNLDLKYTDPHTRGEYFWRINLLQIAEWVEVQENPEGELGFGLNVKSVTEYLDKEVSDEVNVEPRNAKFKMGTSRKVSEFQGSRPGIILDKEKTYQDINNAILQRTWHDEGLTNSITATVAQIEPEVKTGEVNDIGITEILGTGFSAFRGSSANRISNIRHAVKDKLEGLLIKPDEEFSLVKTLGPFTYADGYLAELIIEGDRVIPGVGGGLCQVGTTIFRTAMNSALPITQRVNHGLWVSYYNDPVNGNPGTDATIYDPYPDVRFLNDTGNYILITTNMNVSNSELSISFWGTNDGRKGSYTHPVLHAVYPYGAPITIETVDLAPGVKDCQEPHRGASASFTYTREMPDGEIIDRVFKSYYRPVPQICVVGIDVEKKAEDEKLKEILEEDLNGSLGNVDEVVEIPKE